jgi:hypothetical protein
LIEFGTALETLAFDQAVAILEPLQLAPETEAMWKQVSLFNQISPVLKSIFILSQLCIRCGPNVVTLFNWTPMCEWYMRSFKERYNFHFDLLKLLHLNTDYENEAHH